MLAGGNPVTSPQASAPHIAPIDPGARIVIAMDTAGDAWIASAPLDLNATVARGLIRVEVTGRFLCRVREQNRAFPTRRLRRIVDARHLLRVAYKLQSGIAVASIDQRGRLFVREQPFDSLSDVQAWLENRRGDWFVIQLDPVRIGPPIHIEPPVSALDAFSVTHPIAGSVVVARGDQVVGPFIDPGDLLIDWIFSHFPSGYYAVALLDRCAVLDQGSQPGHGERLRAADVATAPGHYHVFEQGPDRHTALALITPDRAAADAALASRPGRFLLARCTATLDLR